MTLADAWRRSLGALPTASLLLLGGCSEATESPPQGPARDVILIVIDTLRADHLGCYGYDRDTSPHVDKLAARGVRFEQAVAQSSWTAPSMVSMLQSKHSRRRLHHSRCRRRRVPLGATRSPLRLDDDARSNLLQLFKMSHNTALYGALTRTPLLMVGPDVPADTVVVTPVENVDIVPTVLEWLGLPGSEACDGRSLVTTVKAASRGAEACSRPSTWSNTSLFTAVTSPAGLKLIRPWDASGDDPPQLFELTTDPHELRPLPLQRDAWRELHRAIDNYRQAALMPAAGEDLLDDTVAERMRQLGC